MRSNPQTKVWKYCENRDLIFLTEYNVGKFENKFLKLDGNFITIFGGHLKGYAWDGCSPKWVLFDLYLGTPDGKVIKQGVKVLNEPGDMSLLSRRRLQYSYVPKTYYASLIHDILYQFKEDIPISRKTADAIFLEFMRSTKFRPAKLYYYAVRTIGGIYGKWKTK